MENNRMNRGCGCGNRMRGTVRMDFLNGRNTRASEFDSKAFDRPSCGCLNHEHMNDERSGNGCGCSKHEHMNGMENGGCCKLRERLRTLEFAIVDTALYLDAYPESECALAYYHKLLEERDMLRVAIRESCGPMTIYENDSETGWEWVDGPWPWQHGAN